MRVVQIVITVITARIVGVVRIVRVVRIVWIARTVRIVWIARVCTAKKAGEITNHLNKKPYPVYKNMPIDD